MTERGRMYAPITLLAMLGLSVTCDAYADPDRDRQRSNRQIQACIADIGKHADYSGAYRVVHWVDELEQKNLVELHVGITTSVYLQDDDAIARSYRSTCRTGILDDVVKLRIEGGPNEADTGA